MYPQSNYDQVTCLESLVGIRTACDIKQKYPFFIEDIEGVDIESLSGMAKGTNHTGEDFAKEVIASAAREMLGDIELLFNNGFRIQSIVNDMCSTCQLNASYTANSGIIVKRLLATTYGILKITKLFILTNVTGAKQIKIDDGVTPKYFNVNLQAGVIAPVNLNYETDQKEAKITFTDNSVGLGQITCSSTSSCGCGGSATSHNPFQIKGLLAGNEVTTQYGFLPCVSLTCSYDSLICKLVKMSPRIFGLTLLYKIGEKLYQEKGASTRNNSVVSFNNAGETIVESSRNYGQLYWAKMQGGTDRMGIKKVMNDYLSRNRNDRCVVCDTKIQTSYVTG